MNRYVVASTRQSSGKTSLIVGLAQSRCSRFGYIKPLGDRLLYRKKRLWDFDASLVASVLGLDHAAEDMTIGFERTKLKYMYDEQSTKARLLELAATAEEGRDGLLVEAGADMAAGVSVFLDPVNVAGWLEAKLVVVASGAQDRMVDDLAYLRRYVDLAGVDVAGVVLNKLVDPDDFAVTHLPDVEKLGFKVLGRLPLAEELTHVSVRFLADVLFARVLAGEDGTERTVKHIFVGAMSVDAAVRDPWFTKEDKLIITSGDRSDMILAAMETSTSAIILANNLLPPPNIIAKAAIKKIPLLLVPYDTFQAAKKVDDMEPLLTRGEADKIALLGRLTSQLVDL